MKVERISTEDGSDTLYVPELDETYHSTHGAIQESRHVFIKHGLDFLINKSDLKHINLLEFGFGTGLNTLLSQIHANKRVGLTYVALEKYPIDTTTALGLNYGQELEEKLAFELIHTCGWEKRQTLSAEFDLIKRQIDFREFNPDEKYNLIYFDAFAPSKQPKLWSIDVLKLCYECLVPEGVFITYSAKGQLKRDLVSLGFEVEKLPGPPGKFEITRAIKI